MKLAADNIFQIVSLFNNTYELKCLVYEQWHEISNNVAFWHA